MLRYLIDLLINVNSIRRRLSKLLTRLGPGNNLINFFLRFITAQIINDIRRSSRRQKLIVSLAFNEARLPLFHRCKITIVSPGTT